jgi:hypothetical protein
VLGGAITEFDTNPESPVFIRRLPARGEALLRLAKLRNPLNHVTVLFRRRSVEEAGGYQDFAGFEDYHLWARMIGLGYCLENLPEVLVSVRCGNGMLARRGGFSYLRREIAFQGFLYRRGLLAVSTYARNVLVRAPLRLAPLFMRSYCYGHFLRDRAPLDRQLDYE